MKDGEQFRKKMSWIALLYVGIALMFSGWWIPAVIICVLVISSLNKELAKNGYTIKDLFSNNGSKILQELIAIYKKKYKIDNIDTKEEISEQKINDRNQVHRDAKTITIDQQKNIKESTSIMKTVFIFFFVIFILLPILKTILFEIGKPIFGLKINTDTSTLLNTIKIYITSPSSNESVIARVVVVCILLLIVFKIVYDIKKSQPQKQSPEVKIEKPGI